MCTLTHLSVLRPEVSAPLELKLQTVANHPTWTLVTKLRSSASAFHHWATSLPRLCSTRDQTQGIRYAGQTVHQLSHIPSHSLPIALQTQAFKHDFFCLFVTGSGFRKRSSWATTSTKKLDRILEMGGWAEGYKYNDNLRMATEWRLTHPMCSYGSSWWIFRNMILP